MLADATYRRVLCTRFLRSTVIDGRALSGTVVGESIFKPNRCAVVAERCSRSCGLRRSSASSANSIRPIKCPTSWLTCTDWIGETDGNSQSYDPFTVDFINISVADEDACDRTTGGFSRATFR